MKSIFILSFLVASTFTYSQNIVAEITPTENDTVKRKKYVLEEVIVYVPKNLPTATRGNIQPLDLPQGLQVIDKSIIEQQQAIRLSDIIKNINGAYVGSARGGTQESFWARGYDLSANNIFKNGFRLNSGSLPETTSLERVEYLKGNSALLFGNSVPGGVINLITKSPKFTFGGEVAMQAGSYDFYKPTVDVYGPLNKNIAFRVNGSYENSKSFRDIVARKRYYINPSFLFKLSSKTDFLLQSDYLNDDWTPDFGTAMIGKTIANLPRNLYLGATWSNGKTTQTNISGLLKHCINNNWKLVFNSSFQNFDRAWKGTERIQPDAAGFWSRPLGEAKNTEQILAQQTYISGNFKTGILKHQLLSGLDWENSFTEAYTFKFTPATYGSGNVFDFENFNQGDGTIPNSKITKIIKTNTNRFGAYVQDLISFPKYLKILAGLRWSWQDSQAKNYTPNTQNNYDEIIDPKRIDKVFSPKIGLVLQPNSYTSFFASYSTSFTPNTGTTLDLQPIKPSIITQYEAGIKKEMYKGKLNAGITIYKIINNNLAQTAQYNLDGSINTNTNLKVLSGETTSKGIEIDLAANVVKGLDILAGYSYNDMRYTKTTVTQSAFIEGDRLTRTPFCTGNFSLFYKFQNKTLKGLNFGTTAAYTGRRLGGWNNDYQIATDGTVTIRDRVVPLSDFTTIDFSLGYEWKNYSVLAKISNITNELNYIVHENYSVNPIAPRQCMAILKYKF